MVNFIAPIRSRLGKWRSSRSTRRKRTRMGYVIERMMVKKGGVVSSGDGELVLVVLRFGSVLRKNNLGERINWCWCLLLFFLVRRYYDGDDDCKSKYRTSCCARNWVEVQGAKGEVEREGKGGALKGVGSKWIDCLLVGMKMMLMTMMVVVGNAAE